ncbi:MAG: phage tail protein [Bacteroidales bacterium]|nr:phage tail protein [Clostridium sp.]MCM1203308.1 phage tail protein [Bacteroidales bacterium]
MSLHDELTVNYRFKVWIENQEVAFSQVSGLKMETKTKVISRGGMTQITAEQSAKTKTLKLQRGVYRGGKSVLDKLRPGMYLKQGILITVLGQDGEIAVSYAIDNALVSRWEIAELDALSGRVLIDTFEIVYINLSIVDK